MSKHIPLVQEPPADMLVNVGQHDFGFLTPDTPQQYIGTYGLNICKGVYLHSRGLRVLAHATLGEYNNEAMSAMLRYLTGKGLRQKFDKGAIVLTSREARHYTNSDGTLDYNVPEVLRDVCKKLEFVVGPDSLDTSHYTNVMFDRKGRLYWLDPETSKAISSNFVFSYPADKPDDEKGLICATNGDYVPITEEKFVLPERNVRNRLTKRLFGR